LDICPEFGIMTVQT